MKGRVDSRLTLSLTLISIVRAPERAGFCTPLTKTRLEEDDRHPDLYKPILQDKMGQLSSGLGQNFNLFINGSHMC